jgi:DNA-binding transcriptional LysR family regulator
MQAEHRARALQESEPVMELIWLRDFLTLIETGNFSRAAAMQHVTQPAFSRRIKALEDWVGVPLFERANQGVTLTEAGQSFRPGVDEMVRGLYAARDAAREAGGGEASTLRFAATHALSLTFFPNWLLALEARETFGAIRLISDSMQACEQAMRLGQSQFFLCHGHAAVPSRLDPEQFPCITVGADTLVPVAAPKSNSIGISGEPLPYLAYSPPSGMGRIIETTQKAKGRFANLHTIFTSPQAAVLKTMACGGRGIAWLPQSLIEDDLACKRLQPVGDADWLIHVEIHLLRSRALQTPAAERFWDAAKAMTSA